jgi:hypothetical protein
MSRAHTLFFFYKGTPIFISRAVERVPLASGFINIVCEEPRSPKCYTEAHPERVSGQAKRILVDPAEVNLSENYSWRHELEHDVESVFWLLLYWAMVVQPKEGQSENINPTSWSSLLGDVNGRERLVSAFCWGDSPTNLTHSVYAPLWPLIKNLAEILKVDKRWFQKTMLECAQNTTAKRFSA